MRTRKQEGQVIRIGDRWYVRYWERRNVGGTIERKRVTHQLGPVTTRGRRPPADIKDEAERHMATVNSGTITADRVVTISDFMERVYLPWVEMHKRPSTVKGYQGHLGRPLEADCEKLWLKDTRTYHVQGWLNKLAAVEWWQAKAQPQHAAPHQEHHKRDLHPGEAARLFPGGDPARDTAIAPSAPEAQETYAYTLDEVQSVLSLLPEPAATKGSCAASSV